MKRKELLKIVNKAIRIVRPGFLPVMDCIQLDMTKGVLVIRAVNRQTEITVRQEVEEKNSLLANVNAMRFQKAISGLTEDDIFLKKNGDILQVRSGKITLSIPCCNIPFPKPLDLKNPAFSLKIKKEDIERCRHATAAKGNDMMSSFALDVYAEDEYRITTTDGRRISSTSHGKDLSNKSVIAQIVIDGDILTDVSKISEKDSFSFDTDRDVVRFRDDDFSIISKVQFDRFFNLDNCRDPRFTSHFEVDREELLNSLNAMKCFGDVVVLHIKENELLLTSRDAEGDGSASVDMVSTSGKKIEIGMNTIYLMEALDSVQEEKIKIYYDNPQKPLYFFSERYNELIMPVRF